MDVRRRIVVPSLFLVLSAALTGCTRESPADPNIASDGQIREASAPVTLPLLVSYQPTTTSPDQVKVCVSNEFGGRFTVSFTIAVSNSQSGDQFITNLGGPKPGDCFVVFNRVHHSVTGQFAMVTITAIPNQGQSVTNIGVNDKDGPRVVTGPSSVIVKVNGMHGAVANFLIQDNPVPEGHP
jgi:hypothetical protein